MADFRCRHRRSLNFCLTLRSTPTKSRQNSLRPPVPPAAVTELLRDAPIYSNEIEGELITPTGAAIISTVCDGYGPLAEMQLEKTSYGAGTRSYEAFPNVLRLLTGQATAVEVTKRF